MCLSIHLSIYPSRCRSIYLSIWNFENEGIVRGVPIVELGNTQKKQHFYEAFSLIELDDVKNEEILQDVFKVDNIKNDCFWLLVSGSCGFWVLASDFWLLAAFSYGGYSFCVFQCFSCSVSRSSPAAFWSQNL